MKVALVHDWLTGMRGGERCLEVLCELFPAADIFTLLHVKGAVSPIIEKHPIQTSFIQHLPASSRWYRNYLPLFPQAIKSFDLRGYELVISSSHCVAKGIPVPEGTCHLAYIYSPMRYIWDQYHVYFANGSAATPLQRNAMRILRPWLLEWDQSSNYRVHHFIAISHHVAHKIRSYWNRESTVVFPPVNWQAFEPSFRHEGFYLMVSALVPYKRVELAIQAANRLGRRLKIIGEGPEYKRLVALAGPTVELLGWQPDTVVRDHLARCHALLFPGEEDFGIVPLEAMSSGKPVIAFGNGGVLETVVPLNPQGKLLKVHEANPIDSNSKNPTGLFFYEPTVDSLVEALCLFERESKRFDPVTIRQHAEFFDRIHFKHRMQEVIMQSVREFQFSSQFRKAPQDIL